MKTLNFEYFGVTILIFRDHVTSSERDYRTWREHFPIGGQWWPCVYLARIRRYGASKILGSRVWFFGVTWRHRSRDHWTRHIWFPTGGPLEPCVYLAPLRRYKASKLHLPMSKAKVHCTCSMSRDLWVRGPKRPHIWNFRGHIVYSLYNFSGLTMTIRGRS